MKKYVVCEKCHKGKRKTEMEIVIGRTYRSKSVAHYYCKECMSKILKYQEERLKWERESRK